jgi:hypothetical protein
MKIHRSRCAVGKFNRLRSGVSADLEASSDSLLALKPAQTDSFPMSLTRGAALIVIAFSREAPPFRYCPFFSFLEIPP